MEEEEIRIVLILGVTGSRGLGREWLKNKKIHKRRNGKQIIKLISRQVSRKRRRDVGDGRGVGNRAGGWFGLRTGKNRTGKGGGISRMKRNILKCWKSEKKKERKKISKRNYKYSDERKEKRINKMQKRMKERKK